MIDWSIELAVSIAFAFAVPTILLVTVLVHLTVRHFVTIPLGALRRTIEATGPGKSQARAPVFREDEFAVIRSQQLFLQHALFPFADLQFYLQIA